MKIICLSLFALIIFSSSTCKKKDCHQQVTVINNSEDTVVRAFKYKNTSGKCILNGSVILPGESYNHTSTLCEGNSYDLYIVDADHYNVQEVFYSCDSIESKNTVLKHFNMTREDLQAVNFTLVYE